ncbi:unnamed protein product [Rotaria socialis]|uniref:Peptidase M60 domain-containing protein n=1 Tax=Rotaria socialis TaxID=392032 RepID=A0A820QIU2_9BILA|nr:unnamed protein product [Rotaria socialis]CAF4420490.1 unnamed protein product [Rotaria socialis]
MADDEFDRVSEILFDGISSLSNLGSPGTLIPITEHTRAVLCSENFNNVIIAAARFGNGRCLVFAHNSYTEIFLDDETEDKDFIENCRQWLAQGHDAEFISINDIDSMDHVVHDGKILIWDGHYTKNDVFMSDLYSYLQKGSAIICGATTWGWLEQNEDKLLSDFPFAKFCDYIGVKLTADCIDSPNPISFQPELVEFKNVHHILHNLIQNPSNIKYLSIVAAAIKEVDNMLPGISVETLTNIVRHANHDVIPSSNIPIRDNSCREQSKGICSILCVLPGIKALGIKDFPGDFDYPPEIETNVECHIESNSSEWFSTGYYVAAGIPIQIDVLQRIGASGWLARIGCHSDDLESCNEFRRWSCISICKPLVGNYIRLSSAFGGLLFLESPKGEMNSITVHLHNVVVTPTYDLVDPNRAAKWEYQRQNTQGLWADIAGRHIVFNIPSKSVRHLDANELDQVLQFWDSIVLAHHELRGTEPTYRERIVCDEQPSIGYMHSGYPIVTHMNVSDPESEDFILNGKKLRENGAWGLFHEMGHNMQRDWWTYDGTDEVTTNIFTLHAMDTVCHHQVWIHSWLKDKISSTRKYIKNGSNFDEWKEDPGIALFIYAQLIREFGWDSFKAVFRQYEQDQPSLNSDQEKIDHWIETFSSQVEYNLVPLFKFWGFPISQSTIDSLNDLTIPNISDEFIKIAPERYQI